MYSGSDSRDHITLRQQSLGVERHQQRPALLQRPHPFQAHGVDPLENILVFPMLRRPAMLFHELLDFLEPGDDALLAGRATALFLGLGELVEFVPQFIKFAHSAPHP